MAMNKQTRYGVVGVALVLSLGVAWWLQQSDGSAAQSSGGAASAVRTPGGPGGAPAVEVAAVQRLSLVDEAQSVGSLRSGQSVVVRSEVAGRVVDIGFDDGTSVLQGQWLFQLDDTLQRAELAQAHAQQSIARANVQRNRELVEQGFVTRRLLDESEANLQVAQAQVQLSRARLARTRLIAPFDGVVGISHVNVGDYVREAADLVNLQDVSEMVVDFRLPERYQARVHVGQSVRVGVDALPGEPLTAHIVALDPLVEANGRALVVRARLDDAALHGLRPGLFARVSVVLSVDDSALMVPESAVVPLGSRQTVFILQPALAEGSAPTVQQVTVQLGLRRDGLVHIVQGLEPSHTVVVAGQQRLRTDGMAVRVVDLNRPTSP